MVNIIKQEVVI